MVPDFSKATVETLSKRAAFMCSNPDCRVSTVGPHSEASKATVIGEAAHIFGARAASARYRQEMSDQVRGEITNGIWLCVNCHRLVDRDGDRFPPALLFAWREEHERYVTTALGTATDRIRFDVAKAELAPFAAYSPIVRRIVADKPKGWEWRLTAELMRFLNEPVFRRLDDLENGFYTRSLQPVSAGEAPTWLKSCLAEMSRLVTPLPKLIDRLNASWGPPGVPGDALEIDHCCRLIQDALGLVE
ncbi:hypothetical protein NDL68_29905, partial [Neorhizobium galegae]|nr:hypothetical protein [Neorhizobium galegae]MCQ1775499.1 hypothetical protein [Neorhizobium galegae]